MYFSPPANPARTGRNFVPWPGWLGMGLLLTMAPAEPLREVTLNHRVPTPAVAKLRARLAPFLHQEFTPALAEAITDVILQHYQVHDFPVVQVSLMEGAFARGELQVDVVEGRVEEVRSSGGAHLAVVPVRLHPGSVITATALQRELDWLNRNPFREATLAATPGTTPDLAKLDFASSDRWPVAVWSTYSNDGVHPLGGDRWLAGVSLGDFLKWDHTLTVQGQMADDSALYHALLGEWRLRLPWRHELSLSAASVETSAPVNDGLGVDSTAWFATARYRIPWRSSLEWNGEHWLGVDMKHFSTDVIFGGTSDVVQPLTMTTLTAGSKAVCVRGRDTLELATEAVWSPGELWGASNDEEFAAVSSGAAAAFFYLRAQATWQHSWRNRWSLHSQIAGQWADGELLSSEAFYLTGANAVRGYEERSILGSKGVRASLEMRSAPVLVRPLQLQAQAVCFVDAGHTWTAQELTANPVALGTGVRAVVGRNFQLRAEVAWPLTAGLDPRLHLQMSLTF